MNIPKFKLPETKLCVVVWNRNGQTNETLLNTPGSVGILQTALLNKRIGISEVRAVKAVEPAALLGTKW